MSAPGDFAPKRPQIRGGARSERGGDLEVAAQANEGPTKEVGSFRRKIGQSWGLGRFLFLIAFTVGFASLGIWQVRRQYEVIASGYAIDRDLFEYRRLLERQKRLSLLLSAYKDPTALRLFAEEDLGMIAPGREQELYIPDPRDAQQIVPTRAPNPGLLPLPMPAPMPVQPAPNGGTP